MQKIMQTLVAIIFATFILTSCGGIKNESTKQIVGPTIGSVYWSPYYNNGVKWVGPVVYYLYSNDKCYVRASGVNNRYGGDNSGRIVNWEVNNKGILIEGHQFEIIGDEVFKSDESVFFKANTISEA